MATASIKCSKPADNKDSSDGCNCARQGLEQADWKLILELLEAERNELPGEIHHTDGFRMHEELIQRKHQIEKLIKHVQTLQA